jgi:hypothetical protein
MPLIGTGAVPGGAIGTELTVVTRRAFVPKMVVQIYRATPVLSACLANAQTASGGVSSVTIPVQGLPFTTAQATDYSGAFTQPTVQNGSFEVDVNLAAVVVPIPFPGLEGLIQLNAAVVPLIEARMNDAGNQIADYLSTAFLTGAGGGINVDSLRLMAGTAAATAGQGTYGNIDGAANDWWRANVRTVSGNPTRALVLRDIVSATKFASGESPNIAAAGPGTWELLSEDFLSLEQYLITPQQSFDQSNLGARAGFTALMIGAVPVYMDLGIPEGEIWYWNTRYLAAYIHEAAAFAFTGFASTLPNNQLGYVGALVVLLNFVCAKRKTITVATGYNSNVV